MRRVSVAAGPRRVGPSRGGLVVALLMLLLTPLPGCPGHGMAPPGTYRSRTYYLVLLRRGPRWTAVRTRATLELGKAHMNHIRRLAREGKLLLAGPVRRGDVEPRGLAGLFLLTVGSLAEARAAAQSDPGVRAGRFEVEVLPWMGPDGLTYPGGPAAR